MHRIPEAPTSSYKKTYSLSKMTLRSDGSKPDNIFDYLTPEKESALASKGDFENQKSWPLTRLFVLNATQTIVRESYNFNGEKTAEFGCGMYGWFYNYLLSNRRNWSQFDINPRIVRHNRKFSLVSLCRHPRVKVGSIYEMPLKDSSVDVVLGYNSWDSIYNFETSAAEVMRCLRPGGHFIHFQDLGPSPEVLLLTEARKRIKRGLDSSFPATFFEERKPLCLEGTDIEVGFSRTEHIVKIDSLDWGDVRLGTYLINHLRDVFSNQGFDVKVCEEKDKEITIPRKRWKRKFRRFYKPHPDVNYYHDAYGRHDLGVDPSIPKGLIREWASMDVFIAQKPLFL